MHLGDLAVLGDNAAFVTEYRRLAAEHGVFVGASGNRGALLCPLYARSDK